MIRLLQVCPFHIDALDMGGPLTLMHKLSAAPADTYKVVGIVTPERKGSASTFNQAPIIECRNLVRYRTVQVTDVAPLKPALESCDVAFLHGYRHWLPTCAAYYCIQTRKPYIMHLHGMANRYGRSKLKKLLYDRAIGKDILSAASMIVCSSIAERCVLLDMFPSLTSITVVPHGIDSEPSMNHAAERARWTAKLGLDGTKPLIATLGRINRTKNYEAVVRALPLVRSGNLLVVGPIEDREYWRELQSLGENLGIANRMQYISGLYGHEKTSLLAAAGAFVTTSLLDSFNLAVAEAVAQGTPALFPQWIGIAEYLKVAGAYALPAIDPETVAATLERALAGPRVPIENCLPNLRWQSVLAEYARIVGHLGLGATRHRPVAA